MSNNYTWMKPDTAGIMFASLHTKTSSRVVRISIVLNENIDPVRLKQAVIHVLPKFPGMCYRFKNGFFWGYLEKTQVLPEIIEETNIPASPQWIGRNGGPEFKILFFKRRISIEASHILGDGTGLLQFLSAIVCAYFNEDYQINVSKKNYENAYRRYDTKEKLNLLKRKNAYHHDNKFINGYTKHIFGIVSVEQIKEKAKQLNVTITEYLAAVMILAIIKNSKDAINKNISLAVPVNLRKMFETETLRNFAVDVPIDFDPKGKANYELEDICNEIRGQIKNNSNKENLQAIINNYCSLTNNPVVRGLPTFIKYPVLRQIQKSIHVKTMTAMLSNVGNIELSDKISSYVERVEVVGGNSQLYGLTTVCGVVASKGFLNICFSLTNKDTSLCREFFVILTQMNIDVRIESTDGNGVNKYEM